MENETNNHLIWCSVAGTGKETDIAPFNELDIVPVNYSSAMADSVYRDSYHDERLQLWVDNLNLLYVAFTRACKNLIIWSKAGQKGSVSELLSQTVPDLKVWDAKDEALDETSPTVYTLGTLCPSAEVKAQQSDNPLGASPENFPYM